MQEWYKALYMAGLFEFNAEVFIVLDGADSRRQVSVNDLEGKVSKLPVYQACFT